ncbi:hypothetical protein JCM13580A_10050 [Streptomyces drozdowiczii]
MDVLSHQLGRHLDQATAPPTHRAESSELVGQDLVFLTDGGRRTADGGRRTVQDVTRRRHHEITAIVQKMASEQRATLVQALNIFNQAGGEPLIAHLDETLNP